MKTLFKLLAICTLFGAVFLTACSPSSKNEAQYWEHHKTDSEEFKTRYAGFTTVIDENMKAATAIMDEAAKIEDEAKKAEKMQAGNAEAAKVVGRIKELTVKMDGVNDTIDELGKLKLSGAEAKKRKKAMEDASKVVGDVETAMVAAAPTNATEAEEVLSTQIGELISAQSAADRTLSSLKPKKKKKSKKKK